MLIRFGRRHRYHTNGMGARHDVRDVTATNIQPTLQIRPIATFTCSTWEGIVIHTCYRLAFVRNTTAGCYQPYVILCDTIQPFRTKQLSFLHRAVYWHDCDFQETLVPLKWCVSNPVMPVGCKRVPEPEAVRILDIYTKDGGIIHSLNHVYIWHVPRA